MTRYRECRARTRQAAGTALCRPRPAIRCYRSMLRYSSARSFPTISYKTNSSEKTPSREDETAKVWLPGDPSIRLNDPQTATSLLEQYATPKLNAFAKHLWLVGRPDSTHIATLTHQVVRRRRIVVTGDPELHLVWIHDRIFIKPLPDYLLSYTFWEHSILRMESCSGSVQNSALCEALSGFIRTYCHLIRHKSDFLLATHSDHQLINPKLRFSDLMQLLQAIERRVTDRDVSPRWRYGELRLSRLNFWSRALLKHHNFVKIHGQYSEYVAQFYAPLLFIFAVLSVILNAMQVGLSIDRDSAGDLYANIFASLSKVFVVLSLFIVAVAVIWFLVTIFAVAARVALLGLRTQAQKRIRQRRAR